ncbi:MAG: hypothetical protein A3I38_01110 [Candidatus Wildermuthbacteria bacterium RIFCSPLOWO2_02_FULL_47_10]|nr:MAG: hypothetical protein A3I38_01110 [Candidatus Wildermuthbacteria bacterium RIFCSPLOWO2_02_FULL_47_10]
MIDCVGLLLKPLKDSGFWKEVRRMKNGLTVFRAKVRGWLMNPDGETLCHSCWSDYLLQFPEQDEKGRAVRRMMQEESMLLSRAIPGYQHSISKEEATGARRQFRSADGWHAFCERCNESILVPYSPGETPPGKYLPETKKIKHRPTARPQAVKKIAYR